MKTKLTKNMSCTAPPAKQRVRFEYDDVAAGKVCLAGTFNDWHPAVSEMLPLGSGKWVKELELAPGAYEYRFVIDGRWTQDPRCARTVPNTFGETNSLLIVPEPPRRATGRMRNGAAATVAM
jgi:1,4-alpha-glucan branching enzyme